MNFAALIYCFIIFGTASSLTPDDGLQNLEEGRKLFHQGNYERASRHFWQAVLFHSEAKIRNNNHEVYSVQDAFRPFLECYARQGKILDAYLFIAEESIRRNEQAMAEVYIEQVLSMDSTNENALRLKEALLLLSPPSSSPDNSLEKAAEMYDLGTSLFDEKNFEAAADAFDKSCTIADGNMAFGSACINAVYCRANIMEWGYNATQFEKDMQMIEAITHKEAKAWRSVDSDGTIHWKRATSLHPHMCLGLQFKDSMLKRYVAESYAVLDEPMARYKLNGGRALALPSDLPYDHSKKDKGDIDSKLRIGFVSSGISSKAVLYLSYPMFEFFDKTQFETHIYSVGAPDNPHFIQNAMRGVDWRKRLMKTVDKFHDVQHLKDDHINLARKIYHDNIHILIEWDGYARQGLRAQGLFALRPAPIQMLHQEFLGTSGAQYMDYIITDQITSPKTLEHLYVEKFIYMPNHFFSKGHAIQKELKRPTYKFAPKKTEYYVLGTGTPQENRCLSDLNAGEENKVSFVYCNFNKFLKNNPETVLSWIGILRKVPNSILCLLENPPSGIPHLRKYIKDVTSLTGHNDGKEINSRIHFLPWEANPFDHQMRNQDFCNVVLDSHPYNGHTTAQDALYGGVPIITRSDGEDMASRVTTSANKVLGLEELNTNSSSHLIDVAVKIGTDQKFFQTIRNHLIGTCLQQNPMHEYWDVQRYVKDFERGLKMSWERYVSGENPDHVFVTNDESKFISATSGSTKDEL